MKIAIIGNCGSGKSRLGLLLHKKLSIPLYHIDQYFWKPGWQRSDPIEFAKIHRALCDQDTWIIEGMATRLLDYRIKQADVIFFLDILIYRCLYRVFKRAVIGYGKVYFSSAQGCPERGPDLKFFKYIWNFNKTKKPEIESLLQKYKDQKEIYIIHNKTELNEFMDNVKFHE